MRMNTFNLAALAAIMVLSASAATAANPQSVTANIAFETPLTITKNNDINFGMVQAAQAGTYTIDTVGTVTASGGGVSLGGTQNAGNLTIAGSATQTIDILADNYAANGGVTPSAATCAYSGGAAAACSLTTQTAPGAGGRTLLVGVQVVADGTQAAGATAAPTFDVTVSYN